MLRPEQQVALESDAASPAVRRWARVAWPGFLAACLLEALVFSLVDPSELHWMGQSIAVSNQGVYTAAFFCFWFIAMLSSGLAVWLDEH